MLTESQRAALAARIKRGREGTAATGIPRRPAGLAELPLTFGQEQLWFIDRLAPGLPTYNIPFAVRLAGPLDAGALERALSQLTARHEPLRTRLVAGSDGSPVQLIDPPPTSTSTSPSTAGPKEVDLSCLEPDKRAAAVRDFLDAEAVRPFQLAEGPLLRTWLLRLASDDNVLIVVVHHTVFDGWSAGVFVRELAALYAAEAAGEPAGLPELPVQYADYALWERDRLQGAALAELEAYWRNSMRGFETVQFPTDRPRGVLDTFDGATVQATTGSELLTELRELSRREGTTLFVLLMATLQAVISRCTGQTDLVIGTASANRTRRELAPLIGFLVNTLPLRADLSGDPPFTELLARTAEATTGTYAHQDLPFGKLVETLEVERDPSRAPVFQIAMTYLERDDKPLCAGGVDFLTAGAELLSNFSAAKFDLDFGAEASMDGLYLNCSYKTGLFDAATAQRLLGNWVVLMHGVVASPAARLSQLPLLTEQELRNELAVWNDTSMDLPVTCVHEAFEAQAARTPAAPAAQFGDQQWSYAELNRRASQIARRLRELGVGPETLVGLCLRASLDRLAALIGIWKAGGGYVPLDPELPSERLSFMISDTGMPVLITDAASAPAVPAANGLTVLSLDSERAAIDAMDGSDPGGPGARVTNVAYVIYTSGSTGEPKGVVVEHRQAVNFLQGMIREWRIEPSSVVLQFAAFTFDVSVSDMFLPLLAGGKVVLAPAETLHSPPRLAALIRDTGVTFACLPPAVLSLLTGEQFPGLRTLLSAGSELSAELFQAWLRDGLDLYNGYGPTEASIGATFMRMDAGTKLPPPIGRPKPNYRVYVLDEYLNPVPVGVIGELHIGGAGVARGYLNRPELTRERFIPDPFGRHPGDRLYKTGDLVRRRADGTIVFIGRLDDQVKIRGLRVELGEIETAMMAHSDVAQAVVTVVTDGAGEQQLAGYLRSPAGVVPDLPGLRQHLAYSLPAYMVPVFLTAVDEFPLTTNGKIDKAALPEPQAPAAAVSQEPPATLIEAVMADTFVRLLGLDQVGATDSFFDLGGNSLQAMRLIGMIDEELGVDIGAVAVFMARTPRQLAALLRDSHGLEDADLDTDGIGEAGPGAADVPGKQTALTPSGSG